MCYPSNNWDSVYWGGSPLETVCDWVEVQAVLGMYVHPNKSLAMYKLNLLIFLYTGSLTPPISKCPTGIS
jgi:hypothetical protein